MPSEAPAGREEFGEFCLKDQLPLEHFNQKSDQLINDIS